MKNAHACDCPSTIAPRAPASSQCAALLLLCLGMLAGCGKEAPKADPVVPVHAVRVATQGEAGRVSWSGEVRARYETTLAFRVGGKIIERSAQVGQTVKRGEVLARLDPQDLNLQSQAVGAQIAAAQTELAQQTDDLARYQTLLKQGFISQAEYDRRRNTVDIARSRVDELRSYQHTTRNQAAYAALASDENGVVTSVDAERGQVVAAGQPVLRVAQLGQKDIVITVPENRLTDLRQARDLQIVLWARPDHPYRGELREVAPVADPGTRTYTAKIAVTDVDDEMRLGMTARVEARTQAAAGLVLPLSALYRNGEQTAVWVVDAATQAVRLVSVKANVLQGEQIGVTEGLQGGETVVTAGVHKLHPGQKVRVVEAAP